MEFIPCSDSHLDLSIAPSSNSSQATARVTKSPTSARAPAELPYSLSEVGRDKVSNCGGHNLIRVIVVVGLEWASEDGPGPSIGPQRFGKIQKRNVISG